MVVSAGNLFQLAVAWIATSLFLHKLLLFYPERIAAQRAARKKFVAARIGDLSLLVAAGVLAYGYATTDIASILAEARTGEGGAYAIAAAVLIALAAILKSAQFPMHGWLTEVMEAPTPVSALLHAGVINAGGFILIRFADVMLAAPGVLAALALLGGFTALFGGLVMLTQPAVKTSLAWSTVAQMGFMIFQCGLALFPIALLHIVAHSLYKAHAFLASGSAVDLIAANRRPGPVAPPSAGTIGKAFAISLVMYGLVGLGFGIADKSPQAIALGRHPDLRRRLSSGAGSGGCGAAGIDAADGRVFHRCRGRLLRAASCRNSPHLRHAAGDATGQSAGLGDDRDRAAHLRVRGADPIRFPAVEPSPGRCEPARASFERPLRQCLCRSPAWWLVHQTAGLSSSLMEQRS